MHFIIIINSWLLAVTCSHCITVTSHECRRRDCLLNSLFKLVKKKTAKFYSTGTLWGESTGVCGFPHKGPVMQKVFPCHGVFMRSIKWGTDDGSYCPNLWFAEIINPSNKVSYKQGFICNKSHIKVNSNNKITEITEPAVTHYGLVTPFNGTDLVNTGSCNGLLPDGTKPSPESILTYQRGSAAFFTEQFYRNYSRYQFKQSVWKT